MEISNYFKDKIINRQSSCIPSLFETFFHHIVAYFPLSLALHKSVFPIFNLFSLFLSLTLFIF